MTGTGRKRSMRSIRGMRGWVGGLLVGLFVGTLLLTPAGAHINSNTKHVIKHLVKSGFLRPTRTVFVSPVGTSAQNGAALLAGVARIPSPIVSHWLVKVEPGVYDLGGQTLELPSFVSLEGSGRKSTTVRCACSSESNTTEGAGATVHMDEDSELRSLTIENSGTGAHAHGVDVSESSFGTARIADVDVGVFGSATPAGSASGIWVGLRAKADVRNVKVQVASNGSGPAWGIRISGGGDLSALDVTDSDVSLFGGSENYGISVEGATARVTDTTVSAEGPDSDNHGVWNSGSRVTYTDVTSKVSNGPLNEAFHNEFSPSGKPAIMRGVQALAVGGGDRYYAVRNVDASARIENSRLEAKGGSQEGYGMFNETSILGPRVVAVSNTSIVAEGSQGQTGIYVNVNGGGGSILTRVDNSEIISDGSGYISLFGNAAHALIGATLLSGSASNAGTGTLKCAGVWDETYTFFPDTCPDVL